MVLRVTSGMFTGAGIVGSRADGVHRAGTAARSGRRQHGKSGDAGVIAWLHAGYSAGYPSLKKDVGIAVLPGWAAGVGSDQYVTTGRQHDHTQVGDDRQDTLFQNAGPGKSGWNFQSAFIV